MLTTGVLSMITVSVYSSQISSLIMPFFVSEKQNFFGVPLTLFFQILFSTSYTIATIVLSVQEATTDVLFFGYLVDSSAFGEFSPRSFTRSRVACADEQPDRMYASKRLHELFMANRPTNEVRAQKILATKDQVTLHKGLWLSSVTDP